ncbi:unnamed protein product [Cuscuta epithymum]|uniref:Reverse transcriptase domain-containing protein n=1 Tax=Cuscuta epithymum TaxID=186058 RepID=A0AAV0EJW1_9ASTE|nr:unnamed protein product [Cuscuta epithymum]
MFPDKSPGPDGMSPGFFQHFWNTVGPEVVRFCSELFIKGRVPKEVNITNLVLIPKKENPRGMGDWRPIALCNFIYKKISKVLANRMKGILCSLISENQSAFIPGRSIVDNVLIAFETQHYLKRKNQGKEGFVALKLDMSKAYDRVDWGYLQAIMLEMGFTERWVNLILQCVSTVEYFIPFDEKVIGPIRPKRGIRQGDPLSPYLFILVAEGLSALLRQEESRGDITGVAVARGAPKVTHLFFADDSYLFFKAKESECNAIKRVLKTYEDLSKQTINFNKSSVRFSANVKEELRVQLGGGLGIRLEFEMDSYLGPPALVGRRKKEILCYLKERIIKRLQSWNHRFLSRAGREVLLKSVIQSMPTYAMNVFLLPLEMCNDIEKLMNGYWWKGADLTKRGIRWRKWQGLCVPKRQGGLGFRRLREFNVAMLAKLIKEPNSLVGRILKSRYYPNTDFFGAKVGANPSFTWRSIMEAKEVVASGIRQRVGDGKETMVWGHAWLPGKGDGKVKSPRPPGVQDMNVTALVTEDGNAWNVARVKELFNEEEAKVILSIPRSNRRVRDGISWVGEPRGEFSVRSCYRFLVGETSSQEWVGWTKMWNFHLPPKIKIFFWQFMNGFLPTNDKLRKRGVEVDPVCKVCEQEEEPRIHFFRYCTVAQLVWQHMGLLFAGQQIPDSQWVQNIFDTQSEDRCNHFIVMLWSLWKARNEVVWRHNKMDHRAVMNCGAATLKGWQDAQLPGGKKGGCKRLNSREKWQQPPVGCVKINVDAAIDLKRGCCGLAMVGRETNGNFLAARRNAYAVTWEPKVAEAMAVREAIIWAQKQGWRRVEIETDAQLVSTGVIAEPGASYFDLLVDDIRQMLALEANFSVKHVSRSANRVAHALAGVAVSLSDCREFFNSPPECIVSHLANDLV